MRKSNLLIGVSLCLASVVSSCSDKITPADNSEKTPVAFNSSLNANAVVEPMSKAGELGFEAKTKISMRMMSEKSGAATLYTTTSATVEARETATSTTSSVTFATADLRYWDDLYGREANLSVYAVGVPGVTTSSITIDNNNKTTWALSAAQSATTYAAEDLVISNNIKNSTADNRMKYSYPNFDKGTLTFIHAMSKINVNLIMGSGFTTADFINPSVTLKGFYKDASVNVSDNTSDVSTATVADITPFSVTAAAITNCKFSYSALVIPSRDWTVDSDLFAIEVNGNVYNVKTSNISPALSGSMAANNCYTFNVTIGKSGVSISATLSDWTNVDAVEVYPGNGKAVTFSKLGNEFKLDFDLHLSKASAADAVTATSCLTGYTASATGSQHTRLVYNSTESNYDYASGYNQVFWPDNATFYHFRAVSPVGLTVATETATSKDYVEMVCAQDVNKIVYWGAPYVSNAISPALDATSSEIAFSFYPKMCKVNFIVETTTGDDKVDLTTAPTFVVKCSEKAYLYLSDNSSKEIAGTGIALKAYTLSATESTTKYENFCAVPQVTKNKVVEITAAGNVYKINDISTIKESGTTTAIANWEPGKIYTYKFILKKTGVEQISASITDWVDKTASDEEIKIQ